jgi:hypothetical protein
MRGASIIRQSFARSMSVKVTPTAPLVDAKRERGDRQKRRTIRFGLASEGASYRSGHLISLRACGLEPVMSRVEAPYVT